MNTVNKTYKFRIYPNKEQEVFLNKHFNCSRFVYNYFLNERKEQYQNNKKSDNYYAQAKTLTELKKHKNTYWLQEVNSQTLQFSLRSLDAAYVSFFKGRTKFPRFKSKKQKNTFTIPQFATLDNNKIFLPKFKDGIKIKKHRDVSGKVGKMSITKTSTNKYYVSIFTKQELKKLHKTDKKAGIDLGLKDFIITSDNTRYKNNRYTRKYAKQLKSAQQHLSRKKKGSNGFEKQRLKVAKIHEKISSSRLDNMHKVSIELVKAYDLISLEDLDLKRLIKGNTLSKHISDASWGNFTFLLKYKCDWYGKEFIKINRFYPSSKVCSNCGWVNENLKLSDREWGCMSCNTMHDRDLNASTNILKEGLKIHGQGLSITKVENKSDFGNKAHSMKPEAVQ